MYTFEYDFSKMLCRKKVTTKFQKFFGKKIQRGIHKKKNFLEKQDKANKCNWLV